MRNVLIGSLVLAACVLCAASPATAQFRQRVPHAQSMAAGLDGAAFVPSSTEGDRLDSAPMISGFVEYYPTARLSLRGSAGFTQPTVTGSPIDEVRIVPLRFDVIYNWEGGKWHPFVEGGGGAYVMQYRRRGGPIADWDTQPGFGAGGGVEYFFTRTTSFKGEGRYQAVRNTGRVDPSGMVFTAGVKTYF
jgi:outer membrane protein with beta-barrel domain